MGKNVIDEIAFYIHEELIYDHYKNVLKKLDINFTLLINDKIAKSDLIQEFKKENFNFTFLSEIKNSKYKYLVTNHYISGNSFHYNIFHKINNIVIRLIKIINSRILKNLFNVNFKQYLLYFPLRYGEKNIRFCYGLHLSPWDLDKWNSIYDVFLAHGPLDGKILNDKYKKPFVEIGYPRYDDYFNSKIDIVDLKKEFDIDDKLKTILWMPTFGDKICSIPFYLDELKALSEDYNVILRPHPLTVKHSPDLIKKITKIKSIKIDLAPNRPLAKMYSLADYVLLDYCGPVLSSIYLDKKIMLLNIPGAEEDPNVKGSLALELRSKILSFNFGELSKMKKFLSDKIFWDKQLKEQKKIRKKYFFDCRGNCSDNVASYFNSIDKII